GHDRAGERGDAGHDRRTLPPAGRDPGPRSARRAGAGRQGPQTSGRSLGWAAPAPCHRPGPGQPPDPGAGRRAHRGARLRRLGLAGGGRGGPVHRTLGVEAVVAATWAAAALAISGRARPRPMAILVGAGVLIAAVGMLAAAALTRAGDGAGRAAAGVVKPFAA